MTDDDLAVLAELFRVLGHETRLKLMRLLCAGERSVGEIEALTGIVQPGLSQQLAILRKAGLVATRRDVKQIFYRVEPDAMAGAKLFMAGLCALGGDPGANDVEQAPSGPKKGAVATFARIL